MRGSFVTVGIFAAVLSAGCSELVSPAAPSAVRADDPSLGTPGSGGKPWMRHVTAPE